MKETDLRVPERKYIEIVYDDVTQGYLREFCQENGFDLSIRYDKEKQDPEDFIFHTTVWFTSSEHAFENKSLSCDIAVEATDFSLLGENQDILVLDIKSPELLKVRQDFGHKYQMIDQWPDYRPHITVCYKWNQDLPSIELPKEPLRADRINIKRQKQFK